MQRLILILALAAGASDAKSRSSPAQKLKASAKPAPTRCEVLLDSLERLHASGEPDYLGWDFTDAGCDRGQLYRAHLAQGLGLVMVSDWTSAVLSFSQAREIGGPRDEELLYHLWSARRRLGDRAGMADAGRELQARFPASPWLVRLLEEWQADRAERRPRPVGWKGSFESRLARSRIAALDNDLSNRLKGEIRGSTGAHGWKGTAGLSLKGNVGAPAWEGAQLNLGGEWAWKEWSAEAEWGLGYDARNTKDTLLASGSASGSGLQYSGWNGRMAQAAVGWLRAGPGGGGFGARASLRLLSRDWWSAGLSLTPTWSFGAWSLTGLLDAQHHGMDWGVSQVEQVEGAGPVSIDYALDAMQTLLATVSPSLSLGSHELSAGLGWMTVRYRSLLTLTFDGASDLERETAYEHSLSLSPAWRWRLSKRLGFNLGASLGYDFEERGATVPTCREWLPGHCAEEAWSADAGFSVTF